MPDQPKLHTLEELKTSVASSLAKLTFIPNLLLVHNPLIPEAGHLGEFWGWLEGLVADGTLKGCSLGVSNFRPNDLEEVLKVAKIKPVVNRTCASNSLSLWRWCRDSASPGRKQC